MDVVLKIVQICFYTLQIVVAIYILIPFLLLLVYAGFKLFRIPETIQRKQVIFNRDFDFGIIVTAHQDTKFIPPIIDSIKKQRYQNYHVYVVADDCDIRTLTFDAENISILRPENALHSKIKSIQFAIASFKKQHDAVIILDADNLIHPSFLEVMNTYFRKGYQVVQAHFKPKNTSTNFARMDAIGDMFNFFIEREVRMMLGLSATIWGSGVAIDNTVYKEVTYTDYLGGFDKKLQAYLVQHVPKIAFAKEAVLYDEKISSGSSLENQRTRWISSYFKYFKECAGIFTNGIRKANFNLVYFGFNTLRPPLFIILGLGFALTLINYFISPLLFYTGLAIMLLFFVSFLLIVTIKGKDLRYVKTIFLLPLFIARQILALFKLRKAKKSFLKTEHENVVYIDELLKTEAV